MNSGSHRRRDEWVEARKRNFRNWMSRWDTLPLGGRHKSQKISSLTLVYFSEFPESCKAMNFYKLFGCIWKVVEVSISPRRNKIGKKFGFTMFEEVEDERLLAVRLDNVLIMGRKIHANLPRFERFKVSEDARFRGGENGDLEFWSGAASELRSGQNK